MTDPPYNQEAKQVFEHKVKWFWPASKGPNEWIPRTDILGGARWWLSVGVKSIISYLSMKLVLTKDWWWKSKLVVLLPYFRGFFWRSFKKNKSSKPGGDFFASPHQGFLTFWRKLKILVGNAREIIKDAAKRGNFAFLGFLVLIGCCCGCGKYWPN